MNRNRWLILAAWMISDAVVLVPGGVVSQIRNADGRIDQNVKDSPYGKLCFRCSKPAVKFGDFTDGVRRYYCAEHLVPDRTGSTSGVTGEKRFKAAVTFAVLGLLFGLNTLRVAVHAAKPTLFKPTLLGAALGLASSVGFWFWFRSL